MRTLVRKSFKDALETNDILISPAAPSPAFRIGKFDAFFLCTTVFCLLMCHVIFAGEKVNDPLAMYAGDIMTV